MNLNKLNKEEKRVARWMLLGYNDADIAYILGEPISIVECIKQKIFRKLAKSYAKKLNMKF